MAPRHRRHQVGQLVVALLQRHVHVGPGALAATLQRDHVVEGGDGQEADQHQREDGGDDEGELDGHGLQRTGGDDAEAQSRHDGHHGSREPHPEGDVVVPRGSLW